MCDSVLVRSLQGTAGRRNRLLAALMVLPALVFAGADVLADPAPTIAVDTITSPQGFSLVAPDLYKNTFYGMEGSGDINGDGHADIVMLNWRAKQAGVAHQGRVAVVLGTDQGFPAEVDFTASLDGSNVSFCWVLNIISGLA